MSKLQKDTPVPVPMLKQVPVPQKKDETPPRIVIALVLALLFLALLLMLLFFLLKPQNGAGTAGNQSGIGEAAATNSDAEGTIQNNGSDTQGTANDNAENSSNNENEEEQNPTETSEQEQTATSHSAEMTGTEAKSEDEEEKTESQTRTLEDKNESKEVVSPSSLVDNLQGGGKNSKEEDNKENETGPGGEIGNIFSKGDAVISFFGAKGKGSKFVYIVDHSGSMSGTPLEEAKKEMLKGLRMLQPHHKFNIIFYDDRYIVWQPNKKLVAATPKDKQDAERFVNSISAQGGTDPVPAIHEAIGYKPQVIFFLTDGEFIMNLDETVNRANKEISGGIHINIIEFGSGRSAGTQQLKDLARRTNGDYRYVDIGSLDSL
jgi:Mg-chelatase subunit ChlD